MLGISRDTLERRLKEPRYREAFDAGRAQGCAKIRAKQFEVAMGGNPTMLVWLGKQYLGQRDNVDTRISDPLGESLNIHVVYEKPLALPPAPPAEYSTPGDQHSSSQAYRLDKPETNGVPTG